MLAAQVAAKTVLIALQTLFRRPEICIFLIEMSFRVFVKCSRLSRSQRAFCIRVDFASDDFFPLSTFSQPNVPGWQTRLYHRSSTTTKWWILCRDLLRSSHARTTNARAETLNSALRAIVCRRSVIIGRRMFADSDTRLKPNQSKFVARASKLRDSSRDKINWLAWLRKSPQKDFVRLTTVITTRQAIKSGSFAKRKVNPLTLPIRARTWTLDTILPKAHIQTAVTSGDLWRIGEWDITRSKQRLEMRKKKRSNMETSDHTETRLSDCFPMVCLTIAVCFIYLGH